MLGKFRVHGYILSRSAIGAWVDHMVRWDWPLYYMLANSMKMAAMEVGVPIEWGGDWKSLKDGPHYQLPRHTHPV